MTPLVTVDEFATYLQRELDETTAGVSLAGASGLVRHYCQWPISAETTTFVADGNGTETLSLPTLHLTAVSAVRVDGELLDSNEYTWSRGGQLRRTAGWPRRFRAVEVDVSHGYDPVPDEVRAVVLALATRYTVNPEGLRSKTVGAISRTFVIETMQGDLTELETALISGYRLP